jgi:hypothetical protein
LIVVVRDQRGETLDRLIDADAANRNHASAEQIPV